MLRGKEFKEKFKVNKEMSRLWMKYVICVGLFEMVVI